MEEEFRRFLKKSGRSPSAIDRCIRFVREYESYLKKNREGVDLDKSDPEDLEAFVAWGEESLGTKIKTYLWAIRYYYEFRGDVAMRRLSGELRQQRIERKPFKIKEFRGLDPAHVKKLEDVGIRDVVQMLEAGSTDKKRRDISKKTGVPSDSILEIVKLADLARVPGIKGVRTRLYYDAGIDTLDKLADSESKELRKLLVDFVESTGFDGIAALPKEIEYSIAKAKKLPRILQL